MRKVIIGRTVIFGGVLAQMATASERDKLAGLCNDLHNGKKICDCYAGVFWKFGGEGNMSHMVDA